MSNSFIKYKRAFREMFKPIKNNHLNFGILFGNAVKKSIETLLVVGGFIILFSVIIRILSVLNIINMASSVLEKTFFMFNISKDIYNALISGIFEITTGCKLLSEVKDISFLSIAIFSTMIISWSGFSIHAQASSLINSTDLSTCLYIISKIFHCIFSALSVLIIYPIFEFVMKSSYIPVFLTYHLDTCFKHNLLFSSELFLTIILLIIILSIITQSLYFSFKFFANRK